ncbi:MAG TPA: proline hydroxylase, partial [Gammaproteobacteria bacterium]|nr:proline hydroxylase [Gammaproteobacteria bacterium]
MNAPVKETHMIIPAKDIADRVKALDWARVSIDLVTQGCAMIEGFLTRQECGALAALYSQDGVFRSRVVMERHGFGRGEYKYFSYPLP